MARGDIAIGAAAFLQRSTASCRSNADDRGEDDAITFALKLPILGSCTCILNLKKGSIIGDAGQWTQRRIQTDSSRNCDARSKRCTGRAAEDTSQATDPRRRCPPETTEGPLPSAASYLCEVWAHTLIWRMYICAPGKDKYPWVESFASHGFCKNSVLSLRESTTTFASDRRSYIIIPNKGRTGPGSSIMGAVSSLSK